MNEHARYFMIDERPATTVDSAMTQYLDHSRQRIRCAVYSTVVILIELCLVEWMCRVRVRLSLTESNSDCPHSNKNL